MSSKLIVFVCALGLWLPTVGFAQTTQPAEDKTTPLDVRAAPAITVQQHAGTTMTVRGPRPLSA